MPTIFMAKKFSELEAKMSPESREWVRQEVAKALTEMPRSHIRAMGGELDVIARFPDGDVKIANFSQI